MKKISKKFRLIALFIVICFMFLYTGSAYSQEQTDDANTRSLKIISAPANGQKLCYGDDFTIKWEQKNLVTVRLWAEYGKGTTFQIDHVPANYNNGSYSWRVGVSTYQDIFTNKIKTGKMITDSLMGYKILIDSTDSGPNISDKTTSWFYIIDCLRDNSVKIKNLAMYSQLNGRIILKVEDNGMAYYVHPANKNIYFLNRPHDAFLLMKELSVGITNENLEKIPIGITRLLGMDSDNDFLPDTFEDAIGTDKHNPDTDNDGFKDNKEIESGYDPIVETEMSIFDQNFSNSQKGKIFLQVENSGEAWYVNPKDGKRYFLNRPDDAFYIMQDLGLGISNNDFNKLIGKY